MAIPRRGLRSVTSGECEAFLAVPGVTQVADLSDKMCTAYRLSDGRILIVVGDEGGALWDSERELRRGLAAVQSLRDKPAVHWINSWISSASDFVNAIPQVISEGSANYGLSITQEKPSRATVDDLDRQLRSGGEVDLCDRELACFLCALAGQFYIAEFGGEWSLVEAHDSTSVTIPVIKQGVCVVYSPFELWNEYAIGDLVADYDQNAACDGSARGSLYDQPLFVLCMEFYSQLP